MKIQLPFLLFATLVAAGSMQKFALAQPAPLATPSNPASNDVVPSGDVPSGETVRQSDGPRKVRLDLVICLDTTGSMGDEISIVKAKLRDLVTRIAQGSPRPDVRFGLVLYKDRGDEYVTKKFPFTRDVAQTQQNIAGAEAGGGGDGPESVNEALHVAVSDMEWDMTPGVERLLFLIGDAPPHFYPDDYDWKKEIVAAQSHRIAINTIGCSGIDEYGDAVPIWQELATRTEGRFDYLAYLQTYESGGEKRAALIEGRHRYELARGAKSRWREGGAHLAALGLAKMTGPANTVSGENNLDTILSNDARNAAQNAGTRYGAAVAVALPGRTLSRGFNSKITLGQAALIENQAQWSKVWAQHGIGALPTVNWNREVVAFVTAPHAQSVEITGATRQQQETLVFYRLVPRAADAPKPSPGELRSAFHFVAIPRGPKKEIRIARAG